MAIAPKPVEKKKVSGWRKNAGLPPKKPVELTEEEKAQIAAKAPKPRTGPINSKKKVMGGKSHLCVRLPQHTLDWLNAEAQVKNTTVSQFVRAHLTDMEKKSYMASQTMMGRPTSEDI